ncbi:hypothetical protein A0H81_08898 [Grifola frondosa]|uniref:Uncharacterized protein n=1 Tax=Grifola frondosa TaxID=5627 RepID=A0A1C7M474_GRIFR|nr:hypothetical protein A0H81_08898 [Grifola frondosa]
MLLQNPLEVITVPSERSEYYANVRDPALFEFFAGLINTQDAHSRDDAALDIEIYAATVWDDVVYNLSWKTMPP